MLNSVPFNQFLSESHVGLTRHREFTIEQGPNGLKSSKDIDTGANDWVVNFYPATTNDISLKLNAIVLSQRSKDKRLESNK